MRATMGALVCAASALCAAACEETPTSPTTESPPHTVAFSSTVSPGGTASRTILAGGPGIVSLRLESTDPTGIAMTIGVGVPDSSRTQCSLSRAVTGSAAVGLEVAVEAGSYCVQVADPDRLARTTAFTLIIVHP